MLRSRNASGLPLVTVIVRVASSAVALVPGAMVSPAMGDLFAGSPTKPTLAATSAAVSGAPSEQVMPGRRVKVADVVVASHLLASPATGLPSADSPSRES